MTKHMYTVWQRAAIPREPRPDNLATTHRDTVTSSISVTTRSGSARALAVPHV